MTAVRESLDAAVKALSQSISSKPKVGLVLGSGLGAFADSLQDRVAISYSDIPHMPSSHVIGHAGNLVFGTSGGTSVVAMQGRVHLYEGHDPNTVVFGTRLMRALGVDVIIMTNAAGGIGDGMSPGDLILIEDHINLTGRNCLVGPNDDTLGPRFPDMSAAYDRELMDLAEKVAVAQGLALGRGVYAGLLGPTYETPAEVRMLKTLGAHAVGMSTVLEVIAARHMGARVLGISCITNLAAGLGHETLNHAEVKETAERVRESFVRLLEGILRELA